MEQVYSQKRECSGCTACQHVCPTRAITMQTDKEGFVYPEIDHSKCIDCRACAKICDFRKKNQNKDLDSFVGAVYAVRVKDEKERRKSGSGGAFAAISDYVLEKSGIVYGVGFDGLVVAYKRAVTKEERDEFRGSKYIEAVLGDIFLRVRQDLESGATVLFSGTSCHVAGLKSFLKKDYDNLITVDLICQGVPPLRLYLEYMDWCNKRYKTKFHSIIFRDKSLGWRTHIGTLISNEKVVHKNYLGIIYASGRALRPCCYNCNYPALNKKSDFTLGDFWGIENLEWEHKDENGISCVLCNTEKAKMIFGEIEDRFFSKQVTFKQAAFKNRRLITGQKSDLGREQFWHDYEKGGISKIINKYGGKNLKTYIKRTTKKCLIFLKIKRK